MHVGANDLDRPSDAGPRRRHDRRCSGATGAEPAAAPRGQVPASGIAAATRSAVGRGLVQRVAQQVLARLLADGAGRGGEDQHRSALVGGRPPAVGDLERLVRLPPGDRAAAAGAGLQHRVQLAHGEQHRPAGQHGRQPVQIAATRQEALLDQQRQEVVAAAAVRAGPGDRPGRLDDQGRAQLVLDQDEAAGDAEDGLLGHDGPSGSGRRRSPVMERTAPWSCSSETWTTCEGMQVAWAKASTAVSSPTNSTVLVRSWSESPGVRHEVQS